MLRHNLEAISGRVENPHDWSASHKTTWRPFWEFSALKIKTFSFPEASELQNSNKEEFVIQIYGAKPSWNPCSSLLITPNLFFAIQRDQRSWNNLVAGKGIKTTLKGASDLERF